jgi:hypothetical protein
MGGATDGAIGIKAAARSEMERQSKVRQDSREVLDALRDLVKELAEAEVPASFRLLPQGYKSQNLEAVMAIPAVHPSEKGGIPPWPGEGLEAVGYAVTISPSLKWVEIQGPEEIDPDGLIVPRDQYEWDDRTSVERFRTEGEAGMPPFAGFLDRVRELAIMREVSLLAAKSAEHDGELADQAILPAPGV